MTESIERGLQNRSQLIILLGLVNYIGRGYITYFTSEVNEK